MRLWRIFTFICLEVKNSNETLCGLYFSNCGLLQNRCFREVNRVLGNGVLMVHSWHSLVLSSCLISEVDPSVENWRALQSLIYLSLLCSRAQDCASLLLIGCL